MNEKDIIPSEVIEKRIFIIRGQKVMLDFHIAELYQVETKALKRAVKRNRERFPSDFLFELTRQEYTALRYQLGTLKREANIPNTCQQKRATVIARIPNNEVDRETKQSAKEELP
jgi:hypothetical protein